MDKHLSLHELDLLAHEAVGEAAASLRAHLEACQTCRQLYQDCLANQQLANELRNAREDDRTLTTDGSVFVAGFPASPAATVTQAPPADDLPNLGLLLPEQTIEGYRLIREIHRGGQGVVYEAWQEAAKRRVAVKVLLGGPFASESSRRRFEREVELAANLRHPNIVAIHDSGITRGNFYLAMEYVEGQPLDAYVAGKDLSTRQKVMLFARICAAVSYAHQRGVIHRDLKPSNILVDADGQPFVLDFGLAKSITQTDQSRVSMDGQVLGTPRYMSPEQARGAIDEIDIRTDVYSLGMILYEMITGRSPFPPTDSLSTLLRNIIEVDPPRPSRAGRPVDSDVDVIILKAMAKEPHRRYQSAAELGHDLQCWLDGLPIVARSASSAYLLRKLVVRHRYASTMVGLVLAIILAFSYISFHFYLQADGNRRRAEDLAGRMSAQSAESFAFAQQAAFGQILRALQDGQRREAAGMARFLSPTSPEGLAAAFLLDGRPLAEKLPALRARMPAGHAAFGEYVVAEHLLRDGQQEQALEAYRGAEQLLRQKQGLVSRWLASRVEARLRELTDRPGQTVPDAKEVQRP